VLASGGFPCVTDRRRAPQQLHECVGRAHVRSGRVGAYPDPDPNHGEIDADVRKQPPVELLNRELNSALEDPSIKARLDQFGDVAFPQSSTSFAKFIADETNKWAKVVKFAAVKAE
jgi:hypothetical protein